LNYTSFDDYVNQELHRLFIFLSNGGFQKLDNMPKRNYVLTIQGPWGLILKGIYSYHLRRWLDYFLTEDTLLIDGDLMIKKPWVPMKEIQKFLKIPELLTEESFVFDETKGFFCLAKSNNERHCLGKHKGRSRYLTDKGDVTSKMSESSLLLLNKFFKYYNIELKNMTGKKFTWMTAENIR